MAEFTPMNWDDVPGIGLSPEQKGAMADKILSEQNRGAQIAGELKATRPEFTPMSWEAMMPGLEAKPAEPSKPAGALKDTVMELGRSISEGITVHTPASVAAAYQGMDISDEGISGSLIQRSQELQKQRAAEPGGDRPSAIPGIKMKDIRDFGQNLGFSLTAMGAGLAAGIPASIVGSLATPAVGAVAGYGAGMTAAGRVGYNMDVNQVTRQLKEAADEESQRVNGRPQNPEEWQAKFDAMKGEIQKHGLYEAVPEALGSGAGFAILTTAAKVFGKGVVARFASKLAALYGEEMLTETVTQIGQQGAETRMGLHPGEKERSFASPEDWLESAKEVAPQIFLLTTLTAGGLKAGQMAYDAAKGTPSAPADTTTAPPEPAAPAVAPPEQPGEYLYQGVRPGSDPNNPSYWFTDSLDEAKMWAKSEQGDGGDGGGGHIVVVRKADIVPYADSIEPSGRNDFPNSTHYYTGGPKGGQKARTVVKTLDANGNEISAETTTSDVPRQQLSPIDQARADAQILKSGQTIQNANETRLKNATLLSVYGENAAVRYVIEQPDVFGGVGDAMFMAAPAFEKAKAAMGGRTAELDITSDFLGALEELTQGAARGQTLAQAMAHSVAHDISREGLEMMAFVDENSGNPKKLAQFLEDVLHEIEWQSGAQSENRGRVAKMMEELAATKAKEKAKQQASEMAAKEVEKVAKEQSVSEAEAKAKRRKESEEGRMGKQAATEVKVKAVNKRETEALKGAETALAAAFKAAKPLKPKGKPNAKPSAEAGGAVPPGTPSNPQAGPGQGEAAPGRREGAVPEPDKPVAKVNAQPVREEGNRSRAAEKPVNRGTAISAERKAKAAVKPKSHLFAAIKEMGGLSSKLMATLTGESNAVGKKGVRGDIFKKRGPKAKYATEDLSDIARNLKGRGYLIDTDVVDGGAGQVEQMIAEEMDRPGTHRSAFDEQAVFDQMSREREAAEKSQAERELKAEGLPASPENLDHETMLADAMQQVGEDAVERLAIQHENADDFYAAVLQLSKEQSNAGQPENAGANQGGEAAGGVAPADEVGTSPVESPEEAGRRKFKKRSAEIAAEQARRIAAIGEVGDYAILKSAHPNGGWKAVLENASGEGGWRLQSFDGNGFFGHELFKTKEAAIASATSEGFYARDDGALDRIQDTPAFQRGLAAGDIIRRANSKQLDWETAHKQLDALGPLEKPALELVGQSEEEIAASEKAAREAKAKEDAAGKAAEAKAKAETERKAIAQRSAAVAGDFNLTATEAVDKKTQQKADAKAAEQQLAGQGDIFGAQPAATELTVNDIPADLKISLPVLVESTGITEQIEQNARKAFAHTNGRVNRLESLLGCLRG